MNDIFDQTPAQEFLHPQHGKRKPYGRRFKRRKHGNPEYYKRLDSYDWKLLKRQIINQRGLRCERCTWFAGRPGLLDLHHLTYERLGHELPEDVKLLCRDCHRIVTRENRGI